MPDTYPIGGIPPLTAYEGQTLTFTVTSPLGDKTEFSKRATPSPKGKMTIDEETGLFSYTPSPEDKEEIAVAIRAAKGTKEEKQKITITPHPKLPSEFNFIEHVSAQPPDPASRLYTTFAEQDAVNEAEWFNRAGLDTDPKIITKKVTISGVRVVIEKNDDAGSVYNRLKDRKDLKELTICADEVVIRSELKVPGTDVTIYARRLRFEDTGGVARIDTTPEAMTVGAGVDKGLNGQKGGDVRLYAQNIDMPGNAIRIVANGATGQKARIGVAGEDGSSVSKWDGKVRVETTDFDFTNDLKAFPGQGFTGTPVIVSVYQEVPFGDRKKRDEPRFENGRWPTSGKDPKVFPGQPGRGGDGGTITSPFHDQLASRIKQEAGNAGEMATDIAPAKAGTPIESINARFVYRKDIRGITVARFYVVDERYTKPGKPGKALPADGPAPKAGTLKPVSGTIYWLHPTIVRALVPYANDAILTGHAEAARALLTTYRDAVKAAADANKGDLLWPVLLNELDTMIQRINGPYDYFGNPAGWVPMLSFQANKELYKSELDSAIGIMFMAYWIENNQKKKKEKSEAVIKAMAKLRGESNQAVANYEAAQKKLANLDGQVTKIQGKLKTRLQDLKDTRERLLRETKDNLQLEHIIRSSAKVLGGVLQLIPVGQPVLGAIGKTAVALGDIDLDKPSDAIGSIGGAWAVVGKEKLAPKFSKLFDGMKKAKEEEEKKDPKKEEFDKELAKKELEAKVKEHMEGQKKAKETIVDAFAGFAVSEDDLKERMRSVLAKCPEYQATAAEIEKLNKEKGAFTEELLAAIEAIDMAATTILRNQLALIELRAQLNATIEKLNLEALQYVRGMGQRARDRLLMYQYYLVKSYHYLMLDELPIIDFRAQKMFDAFVDMTEPGSNTKVNLLEESKDGTLTPQQYNLLRPVFDDQLREITKAITGWFQKHQPRSTGSEVLTLKDERIKSLNGDAKSLEIDLLWLLDRQREDIRITKIEIESLDLVAPFPTTAQNLSLEYMHDGLSRVRRGGRLYLFRSGEYRVAKEGDRDASVSDKVAWRTDVTYNPKPKPREENLTWKESKMDPEAESLMRYLIGSDDVGDSSMLSFRPSAWTRLTISRSGNYSGDIDTLTLRVHYVYYSVKKGLSTVVVKALDDARPLIRCDTLDLNGRGDGEGTFIRTFDKSQTGDVTLRAPSHYGMRPFQQWTIGGKPAGTPGDPVLTVDLSRSPDFLIEPVFGEASFAPPAGE